MGRISVKSPGHRVSLRAYHESRNVAEVTAAIGILPTKTITVGDQSSSPDLLVDRNAWILHSDTLTEVVTFSAQLTAIIDLLNNKDRMLETLRHEGWAIDLLATWIGTGFGGPAISAAQMGILSRLALDLWIVIMPNS